MAQYRSSGREQEVDKLIEDGEIEVDGEIELDETEDIGEETGYLEDHEEGVTDSYGDVKLYLHLYLPCHGVLCCIPFRRKMQILKIFCLKCNNPFL